ncbi:MAG TPA: hypothetical protein VF676_05690 [Flavobacterium sp.]|jgi:hypothetical protein
MFLFKPMTLLIALLTACLPDIAVAQTSNNLYEWYDAATGSTSMYNGPMYFNQYRTQNPSNNPFLALDEYSKGNVLYDGQPYFNINLKYDIHRDLLLLQPLDGSTNRSVIFIPERTASFVVLGKKFVNPGYNKEVPESVKGYFEENLVAAHFTFYIKHRKTVREIIHNETLLNDFSPAYDFVVLKDGAFHTVKSKKNVISLFPALKTEINKYYSSNAKNSDLRFMEGLFRHINSILK